jgi:hypothetical protein
MKASRLLFTASWVLLIFLAVATTLLSIQAIYVAYAGRSDNFGGTTSEQLAALGGDQLVKAMHARRATASSWSLACALLAGWVVFVPYRRGERWAWWALLVSLGLPHFLSLGRVVAIGTTLGAGSSGAVLAFLLLALLAGVPRMFRGFES